jgi:hypothetical protein
LTPEETPSEPRAADGEEQPDDLAIRPRPFNVLAGARGALLAIVASGLLIVGLWLLAREAPSAGTDPRLAPTATVAPGAAPFADQEFETAVPQPESLSPDDGGGS